VVEEKHLPVTCHPSERKIRLGSIGCGGHDVSCTSMRGSMYIGLEGDLGLGNC
jgi:hypothetical protein